MKNQKNNCAQVQKTFMKNLKKQLSLALLFVLICSLPVQAATKKVTAALYEEGKEDYPSVTTGTYRVTVDGDACIKFEAKKTGTYKFTLQNYSNTMQFHAVSFWKNQPLPNLEPHYESNKSLNKKSSAKYKLKKGDTVYIVMGIYESGMPSSGNMKFVIKNIK